MDPATLFTTLTLAWNSAAEATGYRVWRGIEVVAVVGREEATVTLPPGETSTLTVTAINAGGESPHSSPLVVWVSPVPTLTIQGSPDLAEWHDGPTEGDRFFRIKIEH